MQSLLTPDSSAGASPATIRATDPIAARMAVAHGRKPTTDEPAASGLSPELANLFAMLERTDLVDLEFEGRTMASCVPENSVARDENTDLSIALRTAITTYPCRSIDDALAKVRHASGWLRCSKSHDETAELYADEHFQILRSMLPLLGSDKARLAEAAPAVLSPVVAAFETFRLRLLEREELPDAIAESNAGEVSFQRVDRAEWDFVVLPCRSRADANAKINLVLAENDAAERIVEMLREGNECFLRGFLLSLTGAEPPADPPWLTRVQQANDPLISAIADFRDGCAAFEAIPSADYDLHGGEGALQEKYLNPQAETLQEWDQPATTMAGALEALRIARDDALVDGQIAFAMVRAALGFFEAPYRYDAGVVA